ncbi:hypothetical protein B0A55_02684 [Friedmanniomyces simplex]|uniref:Uncharacterized protein n=1 Tax=Friedmanniomyces simplex TaxID=329884 RepID=A0A4U0XZV1_9PEZI|nr:hypothetical protein B0A55_02684 [Friedmanniomyces simplex]
MVGSVVRVTQMCHQRTLLGLRETVLASPSEAADMAKAKRFLRDNGFTAIKHRLLHNQASGTLIFQDAELMDNVYCPEIATLVKCLTGCKQVFSVTHRVRGVEGAALVPGLAKPIRIPRNDTTPLGTRQALRYSHHDLRDAAEEAGIFAAEEGLYRATLGVKALNTVSQAFEELYNTPKVGPRYATYPVWRPLKPVTRDPLAMVRQRDVEEHPDLVFWRYDIKVPGPDGYWIRQLEMVKLRKETVPSSARLNADEVVEANGPTWHYLPDQLPDEVFVVQLSDTALPGTGATVAGGTAHGSPDLGDAGSGGARESVKVRVIAIW